MNAKRTLNRGCVPAVRGYFSALPVGAELPEVQVVADFKDRYQVKQVKAALSYLAVTSGDLERHTSKEGISYVFKGKTGLPIIEQPADYIGLLLDTEEVILQVGKTTLRMTPANFKALRQKLRSLD